MNLLRAFCLLILILALGCGGGPTTITAKDISNPNTPIGYEFQRLCSTLGSTNGKISRAQFLANAKDQQAANQLFNACDVNQDNFITQEEATQAPYSFENLKSQVILFQTPRPQFTAVPRLFSSLCFGKVCPGTGGILLFQNHSGG
jgi:hypothetical protein